MKKLLIALFAFATMITLPAMAAGTQNNTAALQQAQRWMNALDTATAKFQQIDYQGHVMRGTFYIDRPGRLRFEYDAPVKDFIVADGYQIHFYDSEADQYNSAPIGTTLADFILRNNISFNDPAITVKSVDSYGSSLAITLYQTESPAMGELVLKFNQSPFYLTGWDIVDAQGLTTSVVLTALNPQAKINPAVFKVDNRNLND